MFRHFFLATLGCKVNQYESQSLRESWLKRGLRETRDPGAADLIVVNSCAVTASAVADTRRLVRRLHREAPGAAIILTGCSAQVLEHAGLPGVQAVIDQSRKEELASLEWPAIVRGKVLEEEEGDGKAALFPDFSVSGSDRSRAVVKVQDGCSHRCTYCIVPLTRGPARSRAVEDSLNEARRLLDAGFREIVISGINLRQYGRDVPGGERHDFWDLLLHLDRRLRPEWAGRARLRISSLEPGQLGEKALDVLGASVLAAPHLHLSLQSGSASVLKRMGRGHYAPQDMPGFFTALHDIWPVFGLGADILTGFPGESDEEFQDTLALCEALPLNYAHVFPYSRRPGTAAASLPGQLPPAIKKERAARLRGMVNEKRQTFLASLLDLPKMRVVFEERNDADSPLPRPEQGVNEFYVDCRLHAPVPSPRPTPRALTPVRPLQVQENLLLVEML